MFPGLAPCFQDFSLKFGIAWWFPRTGNPLCFTVECHYIRGADPLKQNSDRVLGFGKKPAKWQIIFFFFNVLDLCRVFYPWFHHGSSILAARSSQSLSFWSVRLAPDGCQLFLASGDGWPNTSCLDQHFGHKKFRWIQGCSPVLLGQFCRFLMISV